MSIAKTLFDNVIGNHRDKIRQKKIVTAMRHSVAFLATAGARLWNTNCDCQRTILKHCLQLQMRNLEAAFCYGQGATRARHLQLQKCHSGVLLATAKLQFASVTANYHRASRERRWLAPELHSATRMALANRMRYCFLPQSGRHSDAQLSTANAQFNCVLADANGYRRIVIRERFSQLPRRDS